MEKDLTLKSELLNNVRQLIETARAKLLVIPLRHLYKFCI